MDAEEFLKLIPLALETIGPHYYGKNYYNDEILERAHISIEHPHIEQLRKYLMRYGERVYCYEFYHKIRSQMADPHQEHVDFAILQAELKKYSIQHILEFMPKDVQPLEREYIPDFLLHSPTDFDHQELVIEVKTNASLNFGVLIKDLRKLDEFITRYGYKFGVMLIINMPQHKLEKTLDDNKIQIEENIHAVPRIHVISKQNYSTEFSDIILADVI